MIPPWYKRLGCWLCEKTGHQFIRARWFFAGRWHKECALCGKITSKPMEGDTK